MTGQVPGPILSHQLNSRANDDIVTGEDVVRMPYIDIDAERADRTVEEQHLHHIRRVLTMRLGVPVSCREINRSPRTRPVDHAGVLAEGVEFTRPSRSTRGYIVAPVTSPALDTLVLESARAAPRVRKWHERGKKLPVQDKGKPQINTGVFGLLVSISDARCRERDSNPHEFPRRILSAMRLPFRHPGSRRRARIIPLSGHEVQGILHP